MDIIVPILNSALFVHIFLLCIVLAFTYSFKITFTMKK